MYYYIINAIFSEKVSKGRKTPSVKKSQKKSAPKSRKPPSVGSVRAKVSKHHVGRMSAQESLSNVSEKPGFKICPHSGICINKQGPSLKLLKTCL